ncbi:hypothetical protein G7Y89_g727 [Cudoniella acicularis]|uniref:Uncharacterized protein n=1 Tax=Cudoniella acicularis TaxID=354080 RepID=A0A8H4W8M2_9HELO|nr:hypothetical protein G7Y89_g727 [Cudoniella acicularis]
MAGKTFYSEVASGDNLSDEQYEKLPKRRTSWTPPLPTIILAITTGALALNTILMSLRPVNICTTESPANDYSTDWAIIQMKQVVYTSAFRYNETSDSYYREFDPTEPQYVGKPSPEIDNAWHKLLQGQYLYLPKEEAMKLDNPVPIEALQGSYLAEVEVMHSLHCLNAIRKALDPEYYAIHDQHPLLADLQAVHVGEPSSALISLVATTDVRLPEHCIEQLRQNIQCATDLTPVPLRPYGPPGHINLVGTPQTHTCRDWKAFRQWYSQKGEEWGSMNSGGT